jgi:hypothetical protein
MVSIAPFSNLGKQFCAVSLGHVAGKAKLHLSIVNAWSFLLRLCVRVHRPFVVGHLCNVSLNMAPRVISSVPSHHTLQPNKLIARHIYSLSLFQNVYLHAYLNPTIETKCWLSSNAFPQVCLHPTVLSQAQT